MPTGSEKGPDLASFFGSWLVATPADRDRLVPKSVALVLVSCPKSNDSFPTRYFWDTTRPPRSGEKNQGRARGIHRFDRSGSNTLGGAAPVEAIAIYGTRH
jgi:hypothetical protein